MLGDLACGGQLARVGARPGFRVKGIGHVLGFQVGFRVQGVEDLARDGQLAHVRVRPSQLAQALALPSAIKSSFQLPRFVPRVAGFRQGPAQIKDRKRRFDTPACRGTRPAERDT